MIRTKEIKRCLAMALAIIMICCTAQSFAAEMQKPAEKEPSEPIVTVSDAEKEMARHLKATKKGFEIGSQEYTEYLVDLLMFEEDEILKVHPQYEDIKVYASEYLCRLNDPDIINSEGRKLLNSKEKDKTIVEIEREAIKEDIETKVMAAVDLQAGRRVNAAAKGYSTATAVKYARKWAEGRNPIYKDFRGEDCTNFVSQCIYEGGKSLKKPSPVPNGTKKTTTYWYSVRWFPGNSNEPHYSWKISSSFIAVSDFYTYWRNKGISSKTYSTKAQLQDGAKLGEVVQLKNGKGKWFHSIIITSGSRGAWKYCGHSSNRRDYPVSKISGAVMFRGLKF